MWQRFLFMALGIMLMVGLWFWFGPSPENASAPPIIEEPPILLPEPSREEAPLPPPVAVPREITESIRYTVPFTSQAPTGDWSQSAFQDGCEEASTLMVWMARTGTTLTREEARTKLLHMAEFQTEKIGHGVDTDISDTQEYLLKQYFNITDARVETDITLTDLKAALQEGLVIVPTNGRALKNPNFTRPGPLQHMLVLTGYDVATQEFITHDPGTRLGKDYRYAERVLFDAIREYPTGKHLPIPTERKTMLVVPFDPTPVSK